MITPFETALYMLTIAAVGGVLGILAARLQQQQRADTKLPEGHFDSKQYLRIVTHSEMSQARVNFINISVNNIGEKLLEPTHEVSVYPEGIYIAQGPNWNTRRHITWNKLYEAAEEIK